jgi:uncharacterized protein YdeI (YjbR/CyaY-like superfamily)
MTEELEVVAFESVDQLWTWLAGNHATHPGVWVRLQTTRSAVPSVGFHDLLEAGLAYGWSESSRRAYDSTSFLQRFTPRRSRGTSSARNLTIAARLEADGRMTAAGRRALTRP